MKGPEVSITVTDLTLRFPVYGVDSKSLKKHLARITVGGQLGRNSMGATEVTAVSKVNMKLRSGDRLGLIGHKRRAHLVAKLGAENHGVDLLVMQEAAPVEVGRAHGRPDPVDDR